MAIDNTLILFDLSQRTNPPLPASQDVALLLQMGPGFAQRICLIGSEVPTYAGHTHLDKIDRECSAARDVLPSTAPPAAGTRDPEELTKLRDNYSVAVFRWLFKDPSYLNAMDRQKPTTRRLRICTPYYSDRLRRFPFELMEPPRDLLEEHSCLPNEPLAVSADWSLVRCIPLDLKDLTPSPTDRIAVLVIGQESPDGFPFIDVKREVETIVSVLGGVPNVEVILPKPTNPSLNDIQEIVDRQQVHCIHFIGHGCADIPGRGIPGLVFCGRNREPLYFDAGQFITAIQNTRGRETPRLAVLNACHSEGFSNDLLRRNIPAVVATQFHVSDDACVIFAEKLYKTLAQTGDIEAAVLKARQALYHTPSVQWASFALYLQASNGKLFQADQLQIQWIHVPAGTYRAGSDKATMQALLGKFGMNDQRNLDKVLVQMETKHVNEFWITKYPITNEQYAPFVNQNPARAPKNWPYPAGKARHPVVNVSWQDAGAFAAWLGCELPGIDQWEKAARGPNDLRSFPWGPDFDARLCACGDRDVNDTAEVDQHPAGNSPYGVSDMIGNVLEWMRDSKPDGSVACKGGSFEYTCEVFGLIHFTFWVQNGFADDDRGFRLVATKNPATLGRGSHVVVGQ